jgi:hypothetical protein
VIDLFTGRPAGDILSRTVRVQLAGTDYELRVLPIAGNRRWQTQLNGALTGFLGRLEGGGNDVQALLTALGSQTDELLDLLYSYDRATKPDGTPYHDPILPDRETLEEELYPDDLVTAVREVWRAANPLVVGTLTAISTSEAPTNGSSTPSSSSRRSTAGRSKRSTKN